MRPINPIYNWLGQELGAIHSQLFMVCRPLDDEQVRSVETFEVASSEYHTFLTGFGQARFFRENGYYQLGIHLPKIFNEEYSVIAFSDNILVLIKDKSFFLHDRESGVTKPMEISFAEWVKREYFDIKKTYSPKEWAEKTAKGKTFTAKELEILETRNAFHWEFKGEESDNTACFIIDNRSKGKLHFYSIGMKYATGHFSAVYIDVSAIGPGQSAIVNKKIHGQPVSQVKFYQLPEPLPENKEDYWEFKKK